MMYLRGAEIPAQIILPTSMRQVDESSCVRDLPSDASVTSFVPADVVRAMYPNE